VSNPYQVAPPNRVGQLGHTDARLTLNVYAQVMQRQRVDEALIWQLMRFPDESTERRPRPRMRQRMRQWAPLGPNRSGDAIRPLSRILRDSGAFF
jgi:hypothetical protein